MALNTTAETTIPSTFIGFSDLPREIRDMIWMLVDTEPRVVCVKKACLEEKSLYMKQLSLQLDGKPDIKKIKKQKEISSQSPFLVILHVNTESRQTGKETYMIVRRDTPVYIDLSRDILLFDNFSTYEDYMRKNKAAGAIKSILKHLVIGNTELYSSADGPLGDYKCFKALQSLTLWDRSVALPFYHPRRDNLEAEWKTEYAGVENAPKLLFITKPELTGLENGSPGWLLDKLLE